MATTTPKRSQYLEINSFLGVDFANQEKDVDLRRSPWAVNMVSDLAGRPEKRPGYRAIGTYGERINGIHFPGEHCIVHSGTTLYLDGEAAYTQAKDAKSTMVYFAGRWLYLDGGNYLEFTGTGFAEIEGFVPTTVIGAAPEGGGEPFEAVNLIQPKRKNSFSADGEAIHFHLDAQDIDSVESVSVGGSLTTDYVVDLEYGTVTFDEAPPDDKGVDSVVITFKKTVAGYADRIKKCRIASAYGLGNDSRLFLTGNPDAPNTDWQSGLFDPTYFPDTGYTEIGGESPIMGYVKQYDSQVIVKAQREGETTLFYRTAEMQEDGSVIFPVYEGLAGVGAAAEGCFLTAAGDPMFLAEGGIYGLTSDSLTSQRILQLRSWYVNNRLLQEENLAEAVGTVWGRLAVIAVNGHCYVANTEFTNANMTGSYGYEWYYWENVPARVLTEHEGKLYFGDSQGKVYVFRGEEEGMAAYSDDGAAIRAVWTTPLLDGGNWMRTKTVAKKGTGILVKPFQRSSGTIYFTTDKTIRQATKDYTVDIFDWDDVDFNRFTFNTRDDPKVIISPKKMRKVIYFQMSVESGALNEGFGIMAMMVSFTMGNTLRRSYT